MPVMLVVKTETFFDWFVKIFLTFLTWSKKIVTSKHAFYEVLGVWAWSQSVCCWPGPCRGPGPWACPVGQARGHSCQAAWWLLHGSHTFTQRVWVWHWRLACVCGVISMLFPLLRTSLFSWRVNEYYILSEDLSVTCLTGFPDFTPRTVS